MTPRALVFLLAMPLSLFSCVNAKEVTYFNDVSDAEIAYKVEDMEPVIQKNDILSITVSSLNTEATQLFNAPNIPVTANSSAVASGTLSQAVGYLVDQEGNIQFPFIGTVKAASLTKKQLREKIIEGILAKRLLLDPIVNVRYLNYKVSVLGEVGKPSVINAPGERISLLEAIAFAGDLTLYARRDNVLLIREVSGKRMTKHINLTDQELFTSPYYYLQSNDVIYVTPNKSKIQSTSNAKTWLPFVIATVTLAIVVIDRVIPQ